MCRWVYLGMGSQSQMDSQPQGSVQLPKTFSVISGTQGITHGIQLLLKESKGLLYVLCYTYHCYWDV